MRRTKKKQAQRCYRLVVVEGVGFSVAGIADTGTSWKYEKKGSRRFAGARTPQGALRKLMRQFIKELGA